MTYWDTVNSSGLFGLHHVHPTQGPAQPAEETPNPEVSDGFVRLNPITFDEAIAKLPEDFTVSVFAAIEESQNSSVPAIGLARIRTELIREWQAQPDVPGSGESQEDLVSLCEGLVAMIGFVEDLMD